METRAKAVSEGLDLVGIYERLLKRFGSQGWWPAETPFEVVVGAILTQRTNWTNVEKAIRRLKAGLPMEPEAIADSPLSLLQSLIRPVGFYRQKSERLKGLSAHVCARYGGRLEAFLDQPLERLRGELLSIKGVGFETADSILLYAANKMVVPVDAYLRRVMGRLGFGAAKSLPYEALRLWVEGRLPKSLDAFKEFRALVVTLAKTHCLKRPRCQGCPLIDMCRAATL